MVMGKIGKVLREKGLISDKQLKEAQGAVGEHKRYLGEIFVERQWITPEQLIEALGEQYKIPVVRLNTMKIDRSIIDQVPVKIALHYKIMPIRLENNKLTVAISNPHDVRSLDQLRLALKQRFTIESVLATDVEIRQAIEMYYGLGAKTVHQILDDKDKAPVREPAPAPEIVEDIRHSDDVASVIKLVNQILLEAHERQATDIHMEPYRGKIRLRYRVDGVLTTVDTPPSIKRLYPAIVSRIKIISNLDLIERRIPQDGRSAAKVGDVKMDIRTSVIPSLTGESVVMRLLPSQMLYNLKELGFQGNDLTRIESLIQQPQGLIFITGPTGCGKSTTLYACLKQINVEERKIITLEDPVEYELEGVTQVPVNNSVGLTFAQGLRSMLRHDPDVMMVGEVRDHETAELAIRIALTGHLVFSTLHTNDAASGVTRLLDMGIDPFLITSSVRCFVAQRLIRLNCNKCKKQAPSDWPEAKKIYRGSGCEACQGTGFRGRDAIHELLFMNLELRNLVLEKASADKIRACAVKMGMSTLLEEGWKKVRAGLTSPEEILRVTTNEETG